MRTRAPVVYLAVSLLLVSSASQGYSYEEMSLEDKAKASELVLIGQVSTIFEKGCKSRYTCASLKVVNVVKGVPKGGIFVLFDGPIAEWNPECCEVGVSYLFFLKHLDGNFFSSTDGPYGVYKVSP
ncbi:MAG TPA: hypothetical protein VJ724_15970 [Tahibacter sp.]|nr:hypothetical protein [Tahibacter sp.]